MKKYWAFYKANLLNTIVYRGPIAVWLISNFFSIGAVIAVWISASAGETIGGYTKSELIAYYIVSLFLQWLTNWLPFYSVQQEIETGDIALSTLTKPISFFWKKFFEEAGWHTVGLLVGIFASLIFAYMLGNTLVWELTLTNAPLILMVTLLTTVVVFTTSLCMGMIAFWSTQIWALDSLFWAAKLFLGGQGIPLSFFPSSIQIILTILPFRYMFSFPLEIYFGKLTNWQIIEGIVIQLFWIMSLFQLYRILWNRGRRAYTSFGQ